MEKNELLDIPAQNPKRGRRPIGERPMSVTERKRRSRQQLDAGGSAEFSVRLSGKALEFVDGMAKASNKNRAELLQRIVDLAIARIQIAIKREHEMREAGAAEDEIAVEMYKAMSAFGAVQLSADVLDSIRKAIT